MPRPQSACDREGGEPREEGGGERRHDEERQRGRVERRDRAGEDAERAEQEAGEQRVRERQLVGRETRKAGGDVVLRRRARREPEARPAVERPEQDGDPDDGRR